MKKFLIEDISVGVSKGGIACGPVSGLVVAEICLRDTETNTVTYHALTEVGGTLNFTQSNRSTFDIQVEENYADSASWAIVEDSFSGGYSDYEEFYEDLPSCDEEHRIIWKLLACLVRADWDEIAEMKGLYTGKLLSDIEIPTCDAEQEYMENQEEDSLDAIRDEYVGLQVNIGLFDFKEGESPEGDYTFEETIQGQDGSEYKCILGFDLDDDGTIKYIPSIRCKKRQDDGTFAETTFIPAEAYERLRDELNGMM